MKKIAIVLVVVLAAMAAASLRGTQKLERPPESWLEEKMLTDVGDFTLWQPMSFDSKVSYKMDERSYEILKPIGIACQRMKDSRGRDLDVVVIAGDSMEAFHDQKVCFAAQGWTLQPDEKGNEVEAGTMKTKAYGEIPVSWMRLTRDGQATRYAVYIFRDPNGFNTYDGAKWGFMKAKIQHPFSPIKGFSYRFIGLTEDFTKEEVEAIAVEYLDRLAETTHGEI